MTRQATTRLARWLLFAASVGVCSAQFLTSEAANYAARAITVEGQVSVLRDSRPMAISVGDSVQVQQMIVTGPDGHALFQVSDGSTFQVYPSSQVIFRHNPGDWRDLVDLFLGQIRVHIEHLGSMPNRNRVMTPTAVISVRGTTFDVSYDEANQVTQVQVEEGIVDVEHAILPTGTPRTLTAGQSIEVYKNVPIAHNRFDKGAAGQRVLRAIMDAMTTFRNVQIKVPGAAGGAGSTGVGDASKPAPPAPPPPPVAPPPPIH
jgi:ferric-dicitrate binding protein FerR (iron transport regulator)